MSTRVAEGEKAEGEGKQLDSRRAADEGQDMLRSHRTVLGSSAIT